MKKEKPRKYKTIYRIEGFPVPESKGYPFKCSFWSSFTTCETKEQALDEIRRLRKSGELQKFDKNEPQNDAEIVQFKMRVQ